MVWNGRAASNSSQMSCWGRRQRNRVSAGTAVAAWLGAAARERGWLEERRGQKLQLTKIHGLLVRQGVSVPCRTLRRFCVQELGFGRQLHTVTVVDGVPGSELQADFCRMACSSTWVASVGSSVGGASLPPATAATCSAGSASSRRSRQ